jgi:archaellin
LSVQYSGADSLWVDWGDDTKSYKPNGIKIYNIYGVYTISVILKTACGRLDTSKYVLTIGSSSIESISKVDIVISPNPASDYIEISPSTVMLNLFQHPTFTLTNILGQSFSPPVIPTQAGISLDVRSLTEGIYILQIRDKNDNLVKTERIVIQRDN